MGIPVWLDCDPGHDDAIAILMALHLPEIDLIGISTVHGNADIVATGLNAARCVLSYGSPEQAKIPIYSGQTQPLLRPAKHDPEIHGVDGLGGVEGLISANDPAVQAKLKETEGQKAVVAIAEAARSLPDGQQLNIVATGALTNIALFVTLYPELVRDKVAQIVQMGGAEGRGNRSPTAEFNILIDPEAAAIVYDAEVKVVMTPLNVTHQALFRPADNQTLLMPPSALPSLPQTTPDALSKPAQAHTPLRHSLSTLLNFFAATYAEVFDFRDGPPVHDPLCIAYVARPDLFQGKRYRVDVELEGKWTAGTTSVDLWEYRTAELTAWKQSETSKESWGKFGKNVYVLEHLDVPAFWQLFQECVDRADQVSPLNKN
ncbi:trifunctional uridine nucleosidase/nicotinamide riboside hydrolase/nicotinic acid riboside hydrolase [Sporobolomyces koalae]|uniref:trifunctional uridine nucleosidase/nicotinamide riboside hydrolase/nicotinic acid riboside hydrolase n=1 Tax=Sporobolomyces koalae TaxID=500713 RepID=UPI00317AF6A0